MQFLQGVLGVVAGVALVGHQVGQRGEQHRQVSVDVDAAAEVAQRPVVAAPGFVPHQFDAEVLTVWQRQQPGRAGAQLLQNRRGHLQNVALGHGHPAPEQIQPGAQLSAARQHTFKNCVGRLEAALGGVQRRNVVQAAHLVLVAQLFAARQPITQQPQHGLHGPHLHLQKTLALGVRFARHLIRQMLGLGQQLRQRPDLDVGPLGRATVAVYEPWHVGVDAVSEANVGFSSGRGRCGRGHEGQDNARRRSQACAALVHSLLCWTESG